MSLKLQHAHPGTAAQRARWQPPTERTGTAAGEDEPASGHQTAGSALRGENPSDSRKTYTSAHDTPAPQIPSRTRRGLGLEISAENTRCLRDAQRMLAMLL